MDYKNYIYKKVQILQEKQTYFYWYLIHNENRVGVHFHGCQYSEDYEYGEYCPWDGFEGGRNKYRFSTRGIEIHDKKPIYENQKPLKNCEVTGGDCYCDGTSLMAERQLGFINPSGEDDVYIWNVLHDWFDSRFTELKKGTHDDTE